MALGESRSCKLLSPLLMVGLRKERGREMGLWFPRLAHTIHPPLRPKGVKSARRGEKPDQGSGSKSAHLSQRWFAIYKTSRLIRPAG